VILYSTSHDSPILWEFPHKNVVDPRVRATIRTSVVGRTSRKQ
jgi:hypothetical protein